MSPSFFSVLPTAMRQPLRSNHKNMYSDDIHLCRFCAGLVELATSASSRGVQAPHHPTYGSLSTSSMICTLCRVIISKWQRPLTESWKDTDQDCRDKYKISLEIKNSRKMPSGVSWVLLEADLRSTVSPMEWCQTFTLVVCCSEGKKSQKIPYLTGRRGH